MVRCESCLGPTNYRKVITYIKGVLIIILKDLKE